MQEEFELVEEQDDEVYVQYDIATYPSDYTLGGIYDLWNNEDIVIPDFQREFVWKIKQASLLIESFLMGLPVPPVFFYIDEYGKSLVIDGQQRILSVIYYFDGVFEKSQGKRQVFKLEGLAEKSPYHNLTFKQLEESDQRKLRNSVLRAINIRQLSPSADNTSVYHIFERLNTGGTALRPQEIRNCVYRGQIIEKLREFNNNSSWRNILGRRNPDKFQRDMELVLRLFALFEDWKEYEKPMKIFLNKSMNKNKDFNSKKAVRFERIFEKCCDLVVKQLGERPFHIRGPLNGSVLDAVMCSVLEAGAKVPDDFKDRFDRLVSNKDFLSNVRLATTDTAVVKDRMAQARSFLIK